MHPANSVILFTTASGLGVGAMIFLGLGLGPADSVAGLIAAILAMGLTGLGLIASTFHLGNPARAIYAFSQWRSSWLSREGVAAVALLLVFGLFIAGWLFLGFRSFALGLLSAVIGLATVYSTAMIYAQLKTVPRWSSPWTAPMFLAFALAGGALFVSFVMAISGETPPLGFGLALLALAGVVSGQRRVWAGRNLSDAGSSPETATGLGDIGAVRLLEPPHTSPNYLMREMVFSVGRKHAEKLALFVVVAGLFAPLILFGLCRDAGALQVPGLGLALILHAAGAVVSRWLFFAEAEHVVGLYYGRR